MKARANSESPTQQSPAGQAATPSVPLSVYRELAAELQATRAMVDSLNAKNQELTLHNQKIRQEVSRFVQSAINLRSLVEPTQPTIRQPRAINHPQAQAFAQAKANARHPEAPHTATPSLEETSAAASIAAQLRTPDMQPTYEQLFTEEQENPHRPERTQPKRDLGGLWLTLTVVLIMVTAFGAGFIIVRPLLPTGNGK